MPSTSSASACHGLSWRRRSRARDASASALTGPAGSRQARRSATAAVASGQRVVLEQTLGRVGRRAGGAPAARHQVMHGGGQGQRDVSRGCVLADRREPLADLRAATRSGGPRRMGPRDPAREPHVAAGHGVLDRGLRVALACVPPSGAAVQPALAIRLGHRTARSAASARATDSGAGPCRCGPAARTGRRRAPAAAASCRNRTCRGSRRRPRRSAARGSRSGAGTCARRRLSGSSTSSRMNSAAVRSAPLNAVIAASRSSLSARTVVARYTIAGQPPVRSSSRSSRWRSSLRPAASTSIAASSRLSARSAVSSSRSMRRARSRPRPGGRVRVASTSVLRRRQPAGLVEQTVHRFGADALRIVDDEHLRGAGTHAQLDGGDGLDGGRQPPEGALVARLPLGDQRRLPVARRCDDERDRGVGRHELTHEPGAGHQAGTGGIGGRDGASLEQDERGSGVGEHGRCSIRPHGPTRQGSAARRRCGRRHHCPREVCPSGRLRMRASPPGHWCAPLPARRGAVSIGTPCAAGTPTYGQPIVIDEVLYRTEHGLIDQSLHARQGVETTNGDGFGIGWYGIAATARRGGTAASRPRGATPTCATSPAHIESPLFLAHIRATTARRSSRRTATRSGTGAGCSSTTA